MNKTYEELQDELHMCHEALAEAHEREQSLAAHVELISDLLEDASEMIGRDTVAGQQWHDAECKALQHEPVNSLARRDLIKQAEALEEVHVPDNMSKAVLNIMARNLRQQAAAL